MLKVHRNHKAYYYIRDGEKGEGGGMKVGGGGGGEREIIYLSLHCLHQNDSCIKMGAAMGAILTFH